jgi:glycogen synthase
MRVLITADTVGGVWTYGLELVRGLGPHRAEVALATMGPPLSAQQRAEIRSIAGLAVHESDFKLEWMDDPWEDVRRAGEWLLELEERVEPDVVHLNNYAHGALPWRASTLVVGHSCVLSWWEAVRGEGAPDSWNRYRQEVARGLRAADLVIAPTAAMLASLDRYYGPLGATRVVPNGRDRARFPPGRKQPLIFSAGRLWDEAKNIAALERVAPDLPWPVYVAGEIQSPIGGRARPQHLRHLGRLEPTDLAAWLGRAAIYALPARYEPFGLSALEAALAGCALVLGDIPSLREVWGDAVLFVPPNDSGALREALLGLIAGPARRAALADRARARAFHFTPQRMVAGCLTAYHDLTSGVGARVPGHPPRGQPGGP